MKRILVLVFLIFCSGLAAGLAVKKGSLILFILLLTLIIISTVRFLNGRKIYSAIYLAVLLSGILMTSMKLNEMENLIKRYEDKYVTVEGQISSDIAIRDNTCTYTLYVSSIECEGIVQPVNSKIRVVDYKNSGVYAHPLEGIKIGGKVKRSNQYNNIGISDYYMRSLKEGVFGTLIVDYSSQINTYKCNKRPAEKFIYGLKIKVFEILNKYMSDRSFQVLKGLLFGDTSGIGEDDYESFRNTGIVHIFAVSGYNIWLFFWILSHSLFFLNNHKKVKISIIISLLGLYTGLSGASPSVVRAFVMAFIMLLGRIKRREADPLTSLSVSGFLILLVNPLAILDVGFLLSFSATASIVLILPVLKRIKLPLRGGIVDGALMTISVQIGMLPIILYYFNSFPVFAIAANLIIVPLISAVTVMGILVCPLNYLWGTAASFAGFIIDWVVDIIFYVTEAISSLPYSNLNIISPSIFEIVLYYLAIGVGFKLVVLKGYKRKAVNFFIIALLLISIFTEIIPSELRVSFVDVGQGDCIFIRTPDNKTILIDGGGKLNNSYSTIDIGEDIVLPYLYRNRVNKIHMVISTHSHEDHLNGLLPVVNTFTVDKFVKNGGKEGYKDVLKTMGEDRVLDVETGDVIKAGRDVRLYILNPVDEEYDENDSSIVIKLVYKDFSALMTGDISSVTEEKLLSYDIKADVLKVPHHGSASSLDEDFLDRVGPKAAVICVGNNNFGHPADVTLNKINERKISLYRTDEDGEVVIHTRGKGFWVKKAL